MQNTSYLQHYHESVLNTFTPLPRSNRTFEIIKRIGTIVIAPLAYVALAFMHAINRLFNSLKGRVSNTAKTNFESLGPDPKIESQVLKTVKMDFENLGPDAKIVNGFFIPGNIQESNKGGYNWQAAYAETAQKHEKLRGMNQFVQESNGSAVIAFRGIFSNFQTISFQDPLSGEKVHSAEQLFQANKFPPNSEKRNQVFKTTTPRAALQETRGAKINVQLWVECNKDLMIYVQLAKALEPLTGLQEALLGSQKAFIIEDTSSTQETNWGDAGTGLGDNKLGWAQMKARAYIRDCIQKRGVFVKEDVLHFYANHVKKSLETYYQSF